MNRVLCEEDGQLQDEVFEKEVRLNDYESDEEEGSSKEVSSARAPVAAPTTPEQPQ